MEVDGRRTGGHDGLGARSAGDLGRGNHKQTAELVTVTPESTVDDCMRLMTHLRIRHLPVLENGRLVVMVSIGDLVNAIIADQAHTIQQLHTYIGGHYPG